MRRFVTALAIFVIAVFVCTTALSTFDAQDAQAQTRTRNKKTTKKRKKKKKKAKTSIGVKGGFIMPVMSTGTIDVTTTAGTSQAAFTDNSQLTMGAFILFPVGMPSVRIGVSTNLYPTLDLKQANSVSTQDKDFGLDLGLIGEYGQKISGLQGFFFGEGGLSMIYPATTDANPNPESLTGFNVGGGAGVDIKISAGIALRVDGKFQFYSIQGTAGEGMDWTVNGQRVLGSVGVAFDL
jgi:hypothetical protein